MFHVCSIRLWIGQYGEEGPVPLTISPGELPDQHLIKRGAGSVGSLQLVEPRGLAIDGKWLWACNLPGYTNHGYANTREQAEDLLRSRFAAWLAWAQLEVQPAESR